jgi:hypothetical protein
MVQSGAITLSEIERSELANHEAVIERGIGTFVEVGNALLSIRDQRLYRVEYGTFEDYCRDRWGIGKSYANELIRATKVMNNLDESSSVLPDGMWQTRPLMPLDPDQQREAWQRAVETAPEGKITAGHVQRVVEEMARSDSETEDEGDLDLPPLRYSNEEGQTAYCKYCYTTHDNWGMSEYGIWNCNICDHGTSDEFMQISGPETQTYVTGEWQREPYDQPNKEPEQPALPPSKMSVHFSSDTPEHYTPREIIDAVLDCFGEIDLDPCSNSKTQPNVPARNHYTIEDDGLWQSWEGRVYMNPPYGRDIPDWVAKLCDSHESGGVTEAIALVPARTDTQWWQRLRDYPVCFVTGRLKFGGNTEAAPFPSAVFYLGNNLEAFYYAFQGIGDIWQRIEPGMFGA